jgi:hypothetical protein
VRTLLGGLAALLMLAALASVPQPADPGQAMNDCCRPAATP